MEEGGNREGLSWPFASGFRGPLGRAWRGAYCVETAYANRRTQPVAEARKRETLQPLCPVFFPLFITSSPQGGPELKGNFPQFH
jgi:hypothetical protein